MALALTPFLALCGFMPLSDIASNIASTPELASLIPPTTLSAFQAIAFSSTTGGPTEKQALKDVFSAVMTANDSIVQEQLGKLIARYKARDLNPGEKPETVDLVLRLDSQFPGDIGIFCAFLLNQIKLKPGEAIFLGAGEPHAYIEGGKTFHRLINLGAKDLPRHHGMHGQFRQRHPRWSDTQA